MTPDSPQRCPDLARNRRTDVPDADQRLTRRSRVRRINRPGERLAWAGIALLSTVGLARGQDSSDAPAADETHPVYSADARWVRPTLAAVGGLFAAAMAVGGTTVWLRLRGVVPQAATHEENPAGDRH